MNNKVDKNNCDSSDDNGYLYRTESNIIEEEFQNKIKSNSKGNLPKSNSQIDIRLEKNQKVLENREKPESNISLEKTSKLSVYCLTWNLCGTSAEKSLLDDLIPSQKQYDIYAIGTQECMRSINVSFIYSDKSAWEDLVDEHLGSNYILLKSENLNATHLMIFIHKRIANYINHLGSNSIKTGFYNIIGNKGAVSIWFKIKETSFVFINCHLAAGHNNNKRRNENFERILKNTNLYNLEELRNRNAITSRLLDYHKDDNLNLNFDFSFVMGDFNYRIEADFSYVSSCLKKNNYKDLITYDQLQLQIAKDELKLKKFSEGELDFPPTFKFYNGTNLYNYTNGKVPGWTDRIFYKMNENLAFRDKSDLSIKLIEYNSISHITLSDHKPVKGDFELTLEKIEDDYFDRLIEEDRLTTNYLKKTSSASIDSMPIYTCNIF